MSKFSKQHYDEQAECISLLRTTAKGFNGQHQVHILASADWLEQYWTEVYERDNDRFDQRKFHIACLPRRRDEV